MNKSQTATYVVIALLALLVWFAHDTLLLIFAGTLFALLLRVAAERVSTILRIHVVWSVWITALAGAIVIGAVVAVLGNAVATQMAELRTTLPSAVSDVVEHLRTTAIGVWIASNLPNVSAILAGTAHLLSRAGGLLYGTFGAIAAVLVVVFVSIAGALEPQLYVNGLVQLFPTSRRMRIRAVITEIGSTLCTWLGARLLTMCVTATLVTIGLVLLHVPLAAGLGILAGVLAFIPNIGAFIAAAPAVLLAFVQSPQTALAVAVMYVIVHVLDDFLVAPVVERQIVKLPPILTLAAQIILGIATGAAGVMLAAPLVAAGIVIVRRLWIEDVAEETREKRSFGLR